MGSPQSTVHSRQTTEGKSESRNSKPESIKGKSEARNPKLETNEETGKTPKAKQEEPKTSSGKPQALGEVESEAPNSKTEKSAESQQPTPKAEPEGISNHQPRTTNNGSTSARLKRKKRSGYSITETLSGSVKEETEKKEEDLSPDPSLPKEEFDETRLKNIWNEYLEIVKSEGRQKIYSSLSNKDLKLKENFTVELLLENDIQIAFFNEERAELLKFMRSKLNNFSLQFEITKMQGTKTLEPYSPQEKFEYMLKKNPHLLTLKQRLDLDIE